MPRIIAQRPDQLVVVEMQGVARFDLAATLWGGVPCVSLVYRFIPSPLAVISNGQFVDLQPTAIVALARARISFAKASSELAKTADVSLGNGTLEEDQARMLEALQLFKNGGKIGEAVFAEAVKDAQDVVSAWWRLASWARGGMATKEEFTAAYSLITLHP